MEFHNKKLREEIGMTYPNQLHVSRMVKGYNGIGYGLKPRRKYPRRQVQEKEVGWHFKGFRKVNIARLQKYCPGSVEMEESSVDQNSCIQL